MASIPTKYEILEALGDGVASVNEAMREFPGFFLAFEVAREGHSHDDQFILAVDTSKLNARKLSTEHGMKIFLRAMYYCMHALNPDFAAMRNGIRPSECKLPPQRSKSRTQNRHCC